MRVVIADDSSLWREGLARLLSEAGVEVTAMVSDAEALAVAVERSGPDIAIIDIRMPPTWTREGADAAGRLRERWPELGVLLLSQSIESRSAAALARRHPRGFGYLLKDRVLDITSLVDTLETLNAGGTVLDPDVVAALLARTATLNRLAPLSERERQVLSLVAQGRSNGAIARALVLTTKTIESHIASILNKLDLPEATDDHRRVLMVLAWIGDTD
ncbi:MAG: response regulator transcription factor [Nocardioidaceae bacterium]|nr:response regulator transcription factor [Nocardioidaceae bacterium]